MRFCALGRASALLFTLVITALAPAFATLGENVATIQADQAHMRASVRRTQTSAYTLHELQAPSGTVVREFVSPAGTVFAVAWQGPSLPDLRQVLGKYFDTYVQAMQKRVAHGPRIIQEQGLVVQVSGHQRSVSGRAYLSDQLPAGVRAEDVK
jgi:hypothetical protein